MAVLLTRGEAAAGNLAPGEPEGTRRRRGGGAAVGSRARGSGTPEGVLVPEGNRAWGGSRVAGTEGDVQAAVVTGRRGWCRGRPPGACGGGPRVSSGALRPAFVGGRRQGAAGAAPSCPVPPLPPGRRCRSVRARGPAIVKATSWPWASPRRRRAAAPCPVGRPPRSWGLPARGRGDPLAACNRRAPGRRLKEKLAQWGCATVFIYFGRKAVINPK